MDLTSTVRNAIGGLQLADDSHFVPPRYEREHVDWKFELLEKHEKILEDWITRVCNEKNCKRKKPFN